MPTVRTQSAIKSPAPKPAGFTLVEVLVVVMVILIIAAIAIPNLVHAKMRANEAAAVASVKTVHEAETLYASTYPAIGYSGSLPNLGSHGSTCDKPASTSACIIMDDALTSGLKSGYMFELVNDGNTPSASYTVTATPESNATGRCAVSSSESGELHVFLPGTPVPVPGRSQGSGGGGGCEL
ncbi:MAG TPA: prepilin-type N-terminal cleavage/methylation domain-containing protein [Candidatus Angelobacter sp.]|nr:prepilin-type N-terminal cleavage/methylation domain-containing protein [Candidatus Angelobacter sp.]